MALDPVRRRVLWIEVAVVLSFFVLPATWGSWMAYMDPRMPPDHEPWVYVVGRIVHYTSIVPIALFVAWGSGDGLAHFGLRRLPWWQLLSASLAALVATIIVRGHVADWLSSIAPDLRLQSLRTLRVNENPSTRLSHPAIASGLFAIGAFCEEFIMRGYLITRLRELLGKTWVAVLISTTLFAGYHIYEGITAPLIIFASGLVYALAFVATRSIWPGTIAHTLSNVLTLFLRRVV
ncbi:MAG: CPBP family intramembrane glutamic endopeptidase [Fimbriimonadales bacterium]